MVGAEWHIKLTQHAMI